MMKKRIILVAILLSLLTLFTGLLTGCSGKELSSPRNLNIVDNKFIWNKVEGADGYMIYFNDNESDRFFTWSNFLDVNDENIKSSLISGQKNYMWIRAITLNKYGEPDKQSDRSRLDFNYSRRLDTPTGLTDNKDGTITFRTVEGASSYVVVATLEGSTEEKEYTVDFTVETTGLVGTINGLKQGNYTIYLIAKADGYADSDKSREISFTQLKDDNNATPDKNDAWTVTFDLNYPDSPNFTLSCGDGESVKKPENPVRIGYTFAGWYFDKYNLIEAGFTSSSSKFNVTANIRIYAKWVKEEISLTSVYFYQEWESVIVKCYKDDNLLSEETMSGLAKANWFTAEIDDRTNKVVFTNGTDEILLAFDKEKPYYKDDEWTDKMPQDQEVVVPDNPDDIGWYLVVGENKLNLKENVNADKTDERVVTEYYITLSLTAGQSAELVDAAGNKYTNYENDDYYSGQAKVDGNYTFYLKIFKDGHSVYVDGPIENPVTLYYYNVNNWVVVNAHVWNDSTSYKAWPGVAMTPVAEHAGWYSVEVPGSMTNILFNNVGDGEDQTDDFTIGSNHYYNGDEWTDDFKLHEITDGMTIYYYNKNSWSSVYAYAWNDDKFSKAWPGYVMMPVADHNGWYSVVVESSMTNIIFNNNAGSKTADLTIGSNHYYNGSAWKATFEDYVVETRTIYYFNSDNYAKVYAYVWIDDAPKTSWPGDEMALVEEHAGWYKINLPKEYSDIIFNDGDSNQTDDLAINDSKLYYKNGWTDSFGKVVDTETKIVYYYNNRNWEKVYAYTWLGTSQYKTIWPGDVMTPVEGHNKWFSIEISKDYQYIIFTNGLKAPNEAKTDDLTLNDAKPYFNGEDWDSSFDSGQEVKNITIYYYNSNNWATVYAHAWNSTSNNKPWPGDVMTAVSGHSGWYSIEVDSTMKNIIFNNNTSQTGDLTIGSNLYFNGVEWTDGFNLSTMTTRTIYFYNSSNWQTVKYYTWVSANNSYKTEWPGDSATSVAGHAGWYKVEVPVSYAYIIFNNGTGGTGNQTDNLTIPAQGTAYYKNGWVSSMD